MLAKLLKTKFRLLILANLLLFVGAMLVWNATSNGTGYPGVGTVLADADIAGSYDGYGDGIHDVEVRAGKTLCDAQVSLRQQGALDIHMSLDLLLCVDRTLAEPSPAGVFDKVRGTGFYSIGSSETTGGRLVVTGGRYTNADSDPSPVIVVEAKSGVLRGRIYNLELTTINGCAISGRWTLEGSSERMALTGKTNCTDPA